MKTSRSIPTKCVHVGIWVPIVLATTLAAGGCRNFRVGAEWGAQWISDRDVLAGRSEEQGGPGLNRTDIEARQFTSSSPYLQPLVDVSSTHLGLALRAYGSIVGQAAGDVTLFDATQGNDPPGILETVTQALGEELPGISVLGLGSEYGALCNNQVMASFLPKLGPNNTCSDPTTDLRDLSYVHDLSIRARPTQLTAYWRDPIAGVDAWPSTPVLAVRIPLSVNLDLVDYLDPYVSVEANAAIEIGLQPVICTPPNCLSDRGSIFDGYLGAGDHITVPDVHLDVSVSARMETLDVTGDAKWWCVFFTPLEPLPGTGCVAAEAAAEAAADGLRDGLRSLASSTAGILQFLVSGPPPVFFNLPPFGNADGANMEVTVQATRSEPEFNTALSAPNGVWTNATVVAFARGFEYWLFGREPLPASPNLARLIELSPNVAVELRRIFARPLQGSWGSNPPKYTGVLQATDDSGQPAATFQFMFDWDGDGIDDEDDTCPYLPNVGDGDTDADGIGDACDACREVPNDREHNGDQDGDGVGDACDCDLDNDGCNNRVTSPRVTCLPTPGGDGIYDQWPTIHQGSTVFDSDGILNDCDVDDDGDGVNDWATEESWGDTCTGGQTVGCADNCRTMANRDQADSNSDGIGDACDRVCGGPGCTEPRGWFDADPADAGSEPLPTCVADGCGIVVPTEPLCLLIDCGQQGGGWVKIRDSRGKLVQQVAIGDSTSVRGITDKLSMLPDQDGDGIADAGVEVWVDTKSTTLVDGSKISDTTSLSKSAAWVGSRVGLQLTVTGSTALKDTSTPLTTSTTSTLATTSTIKR